VQRNRSVEQLVHINYLRDSWLVL